MKEQLGAILKNRAVQMAGVSGLSLVVGGIGGYLLGKRNRPDTEIVLETPYKQLSVFDLDEKYVEELKRAAKTDVKYVEFNPEIGEEMMEEVAAEEEPEPYISKNVFAGNDADWDYEAELSTRKDDEPYVIHADEFINDEMGFNQETLTYYVGDDIMVDPQDTPIYNYAGLMGELKFGHGSKDPNVVYIRNEAIHMEWEILRHEGHYAIEVLGLEVEKEYEEKELRHSVHKFRDE